MTVNIILLLLTIIILLIAESITEPLSECEKRIHNNFNKEQKKILCTNNNNSNSIGPAICAQYAKDTLHLKFDEILLLCKDAVSSLPGQCYNELDNKNKKKYGMLLCGNTNSLLPSKCFNTLYNVINKNNLKDEQIITFCKGLDDDSPLQCMNAVKNTSMLALPKAIDICENAVGAGSTSYSFLDDAVAICITNMKPFVNPSHGITAEAVLEFCVNTNPLAYITFEDELDLLTLTEPSDCFEASGELRGTTSSGLSDAGPLLLNGKQRLKLCENAPVALGPVNCTAEVLSRSSKVDSAVRLKADELAELCSGAKGIGPAKCFVEGRNLGPVATRTNLCIGAMNAGPAQCYRRTSGAFKGDEGNRTLLCVSAETDDPAICANAAPHYLSPPEKVDLCAHTPAQRGQDPVKCLTAVESVFRQFNNSPKKALGYFLDNLWDKGERLSRELLIQMCSFSGSQDPLAAAECLKSAPNQLDHDDAVRMCTDISSVEVIEHMQLCHRILPHRQWQSEEAAALCEHTESRAQVEAAVKCALEVIKLPGSLKLSKIEAGRLCAREQPGNDLYTSGSGPVLACAKEVSKIPPSSPGYYLITSESLISTCSNAQSNRPGQCLAKLATIGSSRITFDSNVPELLCNLEDPLPIITCLEKQSKKMINNNDVTNCINTKQEIKSVIVKKIYTEDNDIEITAGRRFLIWFELRDQYGRLFINKNKNNDNYLFSVSLNPSNPQGAVIWGLRSNYSHNGILELNSLVISQPGTVELRLSYTGDTGSVTNTAVSGNIDNKYKIIQSFHVNVKEDEILAAIAPCVYVFKEAMCPIDTDEADWLAEFPRIRSFSPAVIHTTNKYMYNNYFRNIKCAGDALQVWHVNANIMPDASMWVEYRMGIDSIWTGVGMPKMEMGPHERLGIITPTEATSDAGGKKSRSAERAAQKDLRRAYYKKSLQWHPDRWVGMSMYTLAVQGAFELITEAYEKLTGNSNDNNSESSDTVTPTGPTPEEDPSAYA